VSTVWPAVQTLVESGLQVTVGMVPLAQPKSASYASEPRLTVESKISVLHPVASERQTSTAAQSRFVTVDKYEPLTNKK
jgi:hypothetical protein